MLQIGSKPLSIKLSPVYIWRGKEVYSITMKSEQLDIRCTNLGCSIMSVYAPDANGEMKNIVAGFAGISDYEYNRDYFGCVLGRYANRIAGGSFLLDGKTIQLSINDGVNHLHGGVEGFNKKVWDIKNVSDGHTEVSATFGYVSQDGEEGYPGNLHVEVKYTLNSKNQLCMEYNAHSDKATPVSLSNHSYFNLTGFDNPVITDHVIQINSTSVTEKNKENVTIGNIIPIAATPLDFSSPKTIGKYINEFHSDKGFDQNYVLKKAVPGGVVLAAQLREPSTCRTLRVYTDQPGLQLYTANFWDNTIYGEQGSYYQKHGAVALETQAFPNSPNLSSFPNIILYPGQQYFSKTIYEFGTE